MTVSRSLVLLIDGTALAYQSFYALQDLKSPEGRPTGAVFGFYQTLTQLRNEYSPELIAVAMDRGTPVERTETYSDYKADRPPTPTDLLDQLALIEEVLGILGIAVVSSEGIEADDILATIALHAAGEGYDVFIFSPDKDMLQVVNGHIKVIRRHGNNTKIYDQQAVQERYGCPPERFADLLGLMGDSVDNIPGVPGVGEKTAASLLKEFGTLDAVYENIDRVAKPRLKESLVSHKDNALLSRELATLKTNVPVEVTLQDIRPTKADWERAARIFRELGFKRATYEAEQHLYSTGNLFEDIKPAVSDRQNLQYTLVQTQSALRELIETLKKEHPFGLDTETTSIDSHSAKLVGICIGLADGRGWYLPIAHRGAENLSLESVQDLLGPILIDEQVGKIGHNIKYDARILDRHGLPVKGWISDTMVLAHFLHSRLESYKLDNLAQLYLGRTMIPISDLIGSSPGKQETMETVDVQAACEYGAEDAEATAALHKVLYPELVSEGVEDWFRKVEIPLNLCLQGMETRGIYIDPSILREQSREVQKILDRVESEIFEIAGRTFNPNSPAQLAQILFDERGVPAGKSRSTRQEVLEDLARAGEPLAEKIIEYRGAAKLKGTYLDALPKLISPIDKRLHTSYRTTIANTGRISSSDPNLQNIPIRTDIGRRVREAFIAREGCVFVSADYSQIELRVLAHFSQDPGFMRAFQEGQDIHTFTASQIFEVNPDQVDKDMRRKAKEINFGLNYGMSSFGLASRLGISRGDAKVFMDRYFMRYPRIKEYFDQTLELAEREGSVRTLVGRKIEIPRPRSRTGAEARAAINAPIQGSAADILKKAMVDLEAELKAQNLQAAMVLTVHDELILETPEEEVGEVVERLPKIMREALPLTVPIEVDVSTGKSWASLG